MIELFESVHLDYAQIFLFKFDHSLNQHGAPKYSNIWSWKTECASNIDDVQTCCNIFYEIIFPQNIQ